MIIKGTYQWVHYNSLDVDGLDIDSAAVRDLVVFITGIMIDSLSDVPSLSLSGDAIAHFKNILIDGTQNAN